MPNRGEQKQFPSRVWLIQSDCQNLDARQLALVKLFSIGDNSIWS